MPRIPVGHQCGRSSDAEDAVYNLHGFVRAGVGLAGDVLAADNEAHLFRDGLQHILGQVHAADGRGAAHAGEAVGQAISAHLKAVDNLQTCEEAHITDDDRLHRLYGSSMRYAIYCIRRCMTVGIH